MKYTKWNKYDFSFDFSLSSVQKVIIEIQQFFHCKAKQVFHASFSKIGRLHRGLWSLQHLQERRPYSTYISSRVIQVGNQVWELQKVSADFTYHNILSEWAESGDKVNKSLSCLSAPDRCVRRVGTTGVLD